jgi:hypothetical protein
VISDHIQHVLDAANTSRTVLADKSQWKVAAYKLLRLCNLKDAEVQAGAPLQ